MVDDVFWQPRDRFRDPIPEIFYAAHLLDRAVGLHDAGDRQSAAALFQQADCPAVKAWTESLWGSPKDNPDHPAYLRVRTIENAPPYLPKAERVAARMPTSAEKRAIVAHWGYNCAFCGIPVVSPEVRSRIVAAYPDDVRWGGSNATQHSAFQCMWLQYDHVLPHARGGGNDLSNVVVTCAPCNYGRMNLTLEEVGLRDPRLHPVVRTSWDGLERFR